MSDSIFYVGSYGDKFNRDRSSTNFDYLNSNSRSQSVVYSSDMSLT